VQDLLANYPTLTALKAAGRTRVTRVVKTRSPRLATKLADAAMTALDAQTITVPAEATIGRVIAELAVEPDRVFLAVTGWQPISRRHSWPTLSVSCSLPCPG
jgi:hypothetical protein